MLVATGTLMKIAGWGGILLSTTGFVLQAKFIDRYRNSDYYKDALRTLRHHPGAIHYMGEPMKDSRFKITDSENNFCDQKTARFCVPIHGPKDKGHYYFWAIKDGETWLLTKAELELKSKPNERLVIIKENGKYIDIISANVMNVNEDGYSKNFIGTSKEKFFFHNTLLCLVRSLQGQKITVDLRNDSYVCGVAILVDGYMNISFTNAVYCDPRGNEFAFEQLFVQSRNIRYVHIPENVSILSNIKNEVCKDLKKSEKKPVEKSRKAKKALQRHMQVVASLK